MNDSRRWISFRAEQVKLRTFFSPVNNKVTLTIYNLLGETIRTLVDAVQSAVRHQVR